MEWTTDKTRNLIEMYHNSPELWNITLDVYKDNKKKFDKFAELATHFECIVQNIKEKVKNFIARGKEEARRKVDLHQPKIQSGCSTTSCRS